MARPMTRGSRTVVRPSVEALDERVLLANISVVDLLVGYTTAAKNYVNTSSGTGATDGTLISNIIARNVANLDAALSNSKIPESIRLVGTVEVNYTTTKDAGTDLTNLQSGTVGNLATLRTSKGADLVELVTDATYTGSLAGKAYQPNSEAAATASQGFSVITIRNGFPTNLLHEIGHNLGAGHSRTATDPQSNDGVASSTIKYAHGYSVTVGSLSFGDVMSGYGIPFFSNPSIKFRGVAIGVADNAKNSADNSKAITTLAPKIANYLPRATAVTAGPSVGLGAVEATSGSKLIKFQVIFFDPDGVNVHSLGNANVVVNGAGLPATGAAAKFLGLSHPATGSLTPTMVAADSYNQSYVVANYEVAPTSAVTSLASYTFTLQANQVKNQAGLFATAGLISTSASGNPTLSTPVILPNFGDSSSYLGRVGELGDVTQKTVTVSNLVGKYYVFNTNTSSSSQLIAYRFELTQKSVVKFAATNGVLIEVETPPDSTGQVNILSPNADGTLTLSAGKDYNVVLVPGTKPVISTLTLTATKV